MYNIICIYGCQTGRAPGMASLEAQAAMVIMALHSCTEKVSEGKIAMMYVRK